MKKLLFLLLLIPLVSLGQNKYSKEITLKEDKFDGTKTWYSPLLMKGLTIPNWVSFSKSQLEDGSFATYVKLSTTGMTLNTGEKGAIVLFEDGTKLEFPFAEIDVDVTNTVAWRYSAFISLDDDELQHFIDKNIDGFKLFIYTKEKFRKKELEKIRGWAQGIKDSN